VTDSDLRSLLEMLDSRARAGLRRVLIHDQPDRDAIASDLLRDRDERGDDWADIIDMLTLQTQMRESAWCDSWQRSMRWRALSYLVRPLYTGRPPAKPACLVGRRSASPDGLLW